MKNNTNVVRYASQFQNIYNGKPWYGDSIMKILDGVDEEAAFRKVVPGAHTIAQVLWHMIYWRQLLIRKLQGDKDYKASMQSEDNWRSLEQLRQMGWPGLLDTFAYEHALLLDLLSKETDELLEQEFRKDATFEAVIEGVIQHDLYHLGQIAILKNLNQSK